MPESVSEPDHDAIVMRVLAGEVSAWDELIEQFSPRVFGVLFHHCHDPELAEELTQDTFVRISEKFSKPGGYQEQGRFEPWLMRVAMNRLRDEMRRRQRHAKSMDMRSGMSEDESSPHWSSLQAGARKATGHAHEQPTPEQSTLTNEALDVLRVAMEDLGEKDREILVLRHTLSMSFKEIASTLEEPVGTVLARAHRALGKLRSRMEELGIEGV